MGNVNEAQRKQNVANSFDRAEEGQGLVNNYDDNSNDNNDDEDESMDIDDSSEKQNSKKLTVEIEYELSNPSMTSPNDT